MIANGFVRGALPALGQPKTPATIPHSHRRGKEFRHRPGLVWWRAVRTVASGWLMICDWGEGISC